METRNINPNMKQQGDCIFLKLESLPEGKRKVISKGRIIVAHGESGHTHLIDAPETDAELIEIGERMLLQVFNPVTISHEEHKSFQFEPGIWEIGQVVEKDWLSGMVAPVVD